MSEAARAAGIGPDIEWRGKRYSLSEKTPEIVGYLEMWLQTQAWDALERMRGLWTPQVFAAREDRLMASIAAGAYSWGSPAMAKALLLPEGIKEALYQSLKVNDRTVTREMVEEMYNEQEAKVLLAMRRANPPDPTTAPPADGAGRASA